MDEKFKKQFPNRRELEIVSSTGKWKQRDTAARVIQKAFRAYKRSVSLFFIIISEYFNLFYVLN